MTVDDNKTAVLLFAHGSSVTEANRGVHELAQEIEARGPYAYVRAAFLELAPPTLSAAIAQAVEAGFHRVVVIPYFLTLGIHLRRDLPKLVAAEKARHPNLEIEVGRALEGHPLMPALILERIHEIVGETKPGR